MAASPGYIFGGDTGITAESLKKRRALVDAMMAQQNGQTPRNVGEGIAALGGAIGSIIARQGLARDEATLRDKQAGLWNDLGGAIDTGGGSALAYDPAGVSSSGSAAKLKASAFDTDNGLPDYANAFLDTIAGPESGGAYNVKYGGGTFDGFADHPRQAMAITSGPNQGKTSSAAGRYQFLGSTWDEQRDKLGLADFSPANQDRAAYALASDTYRQKTGQDLGAVLQSGDPDAIAGVGKSLSGVWTSLPGGIEQGTNTPRFMSAYSQALGRSNGAGRAIEAAAPVQTASLDPSFMPGAKPSATTEEALTKAIAAQTPPPEVAASLNRTPEQQEAGYNRAMTAAANSPANVANPVPLPAPQTVAPDPVPPVAPAVLPPGQQRIAELLMRMPANVRQAATADAGFDGFAQTDATPYDGANAPMVPARDRLAQAMEVGQARRGENPSALLRVLQSPYASDEQRQLAGQLLNHLYSRQEKLEDRAFEENSPAAQQRARLVDAQIAAYGAKDSGATNDTKEYEYAKRDGYTGSFADWQTSQKKAGAQTITMGGENTSEFVKKSDEAAAKRLGDIVEAGNSAPAMMGDIQQLSELGRQIGTGKGAQITAALGPYADMLGIKLDGLDETQAYNSIVSRMAPNMRPAGAGATSDFDARQYLSALPSLANTPGGNEIITATFGAIQQNKIDAAEIAQRAQSGEIKWQDAERQIRALPNPYQRYREFRKNGGGSGSTVSTPPAAGAPSAPPPAAAAPRRARNPQTGQVIEFRNGQWVPAQ